MTHLEFAVNAVNSVSIAIKEQFSRIWLIRGHTSHLIFNLNSNFETVNKPEDFCIDHETFLYFATR